MEATKKKKAYIKPRMEKFEMKMETAFLAGSKTEVEIIIPETEIEGLLQSQCTDNGSAFNQLIPNGPCETFGAMKIDNRIDCGLWGKMIDAGLALQDKDKVIVCRKPDNGQNRVYSAKLAN